MADYQLVIIGAGLSGLAAGIRAARFGTKTLIVEQHHRAGGLNSWYTFHGHLLETGLHAMTNFAPPERKKAPLNLLFRQLQLSRREFPVQEQWESEIVFPGRSLRFSNNPELLQTEVVRAFPGSSAGFLRLWQAVADYDPFADAPWQSAREFVRTFVPEPALADMLFLPLMLYGNAEEHDMALAQFVIMFRAVFAEGLFRPAGGIQRLLELLLGQYRRFGGEIRFRADVAELVRQDERICALRLADGSEISADKVLSTAGIPESIRLTRQEEGSAFRPAAPAEYSGRMSFTETIALISRSARATLPLRQDRTLIFYNTGNSFCYQRPQTLQDSSWGVICFPEHFAGAAGDRSGDCFAIRITNPASFPLWQDLRERSAQDYQNAKAACRAAAVSASEALTGAYSQAIRYQDSFTPLTIERFTRKAQGAVYGSPVKIADGTTPWPNLFIAGTDQGYLGIVGAMLSGVSIVNRHILR